MLEVQGLSRRFGGLAALDGASFAVAAGKITGLIGPNGAGKTTLFNCVSGMIAPTGGHARFDGADITGLPAHEVTGRGLVRTFQLARGFARMTVFDHLLLYGRDQPGESISGALFGGASSRAREAELADAAWRTARRLKLDHVADKLVTQISGGQKKLLEIGRALMAAPRMILLDEPMAGVNPSLTGDIADHLASLRDEGLTILLIEHDMALVRRLCDEVIVMAEGRFLARGSFADVAADTRVQEAYLGKRH
jgi:ABC-type branched-subunit amino acid transport system ATPase component